MSTGRKSAAEIRDSKLALVDVVTRVGVRDASTSIGEIDCILGLTTTPLLFRVFRVNSWIVVYAANKTIHELHESSNLTMKSRRVNRARLQLATCHYGGRTLS